jgi:5,10-methylene-tetrahydrofolate dehydrogenase/methenyl tetrahydrofolate cyclohydrolase
MENNEIASSGDVTRDEIDHHGEGFEKAFDKALKDLDGQKYAGQTLEVRAFVTITPNPGGVGQYTISLIPHG